MTPNTRYQKHLKAIAVIFSFVVVVIAVSFGSLTSGKSQKMAGAAYVGKSSQVVSSAAAAAPVAAPAAPEVVKVEEEGRSIGTGEASYYGDGFEGRKTANGERFDSDSLTAAHKTLPFNTRLKVTNVKSGESVIVRVNDRGPYAGDRVLDLAEEAAERIGMIEEGTALVEIEVLNS